VSETSNILRTATDRSLVILDELGRGAACCLLLTAAAAAAAAVAAAYLPAGTSTFDGLAIAWATARHAIEQVCVCVVGGGGGHVFLFMRMLTCAC